MNFKRHCTWLAKLPWLVQCLSVKILAADDSPKDPFLNLKMIRILL